MSSDEKHRREFLKASASALCGPALADGSSSQKLLPDDSNHDYLHAYRGIATAVARTLQNKSDDRANIFDFIPPGQHAKLIDRTAEYDCTPAFAAAFAETNEIEIRDARISIDNTVEIGSEGHGQKTIKMIGGAEIHRPVSASSDGPVIWFNHAQGSIIGSGKGSRISTAKEYEGEIILFGFAGMDAPLDRNTDHCTLQDILVEGPVYYGSKRASLTAIRMCNPQLGGFSSYFHQLSGIAMRKTNNGLHLQGFGNGNRIFGLDGQWIGNEALPADRTFIHLDGAQQNFISGFWFHYSPGSTCLKFSNLDNREVPKGFYHVPSLNVVTGHTEQDPSGDSSGIGIEAGDDETLGAVANTIQIKDVCPAMNIGRNFKISNDIDSLTGGPSFRRLTVWGNCEVGQLTTDGVLTVKGAHAVSPKWLATNGFGVQTGTDKRAGTSRLSQGSVVVANRSVAETDILFLQRRIGGGRIGHLTYALDEGSGFAIRSSSDTDSSVIEWELRERFK